ncbi:hypothetical protein GCM10020254_44510 [Streptomyces goshikiensis]
MGWGAVPDGGPVGDRAGLAALSVVEGDVVREQRAVVAGQLLDLGRGGPLPGARAGLQDDGGAGLRAGLVGEFADGVRTVVRGQPFDGRGVRVAGGAGDHADLAGHDEAGEQADAELAEELLAGALQAALRQLAVAALGAAADGGEEGVGLGGGQADAGVLDGDAAGGGGQTDADPRAGLVRLPGGDGVHGVLQQLADVDARAGVEVVGEQVDQAAQVDLEGAGGSGGCGGPRVSRSGMWMSWGVTSRARMEGSAIARYPLTDPGMRTE